VTGSDDRKVKVVVAETGQVIYNTAFHDDRVRTVLYTTQFFISYSDDRQVMLAKFSPHANGRNRSVRIYNASTGTTSGEAWSTGQTEYIRAIAVSPDGKILAAGNNDYSIILYDMETRKMIRKPIRGHNGVRILVVLHWHTVHILKRLCRRSGVLCSRETVSNSHHAVMTRQFVCGMSLRERRLATLYMVIHPV
jgi:WD40 repeat protein